MKYKRSFFNNQGITLIALVITIIVLLILAGITISAISGSENSMQKAKDAKNETEIAQAKEQANLIATNYLQDYLSDRFVQVTQMSEGINNAGDYIANKLKNGEEASNWYIKADEINEEGFRFITVYRSDRTTQVVLGSIVHNNRKTTIIRYYNYLS